MRNILLVGWISLFLLACAPTKADPCEFQQGDMVRSKVSKEMGQVIWTRRARAREDYTCLFDVRFQGYQATTDSRVLSDDRPIVVQALTVVKYMRPYELERVNKK